MTKTTATIVAALALAVALAGCTPVATSSSPKSDKGSSASSPSFAPEPTEDAPAPEPEDDGIAKFGDAFSYSDGVSISVSAAAPYTPSQTAAGHDKPNAIKLNVTVTNGSKKPLDLIAISSMNSGGAAASQIFDTGNGIEGAPSAPILPGQAVTWAEAWSVADPADLTYSTAPSFSYEDVIFTTAK